MCRHVAGEHGDAQRREYGAQHRFGQHLDHEQQQRGQRQDVDQDVETQAEERVRLALGPVRQLE
jgi:hypothetical protein